MDAIETWKEIECEAGYFVSSLGRIKSTNYRMTGKENIMKQSLRSVGGMEVNIRGKLYLVHRLVAQAFVPNPHGFTDILHKNGNILDNRADNLEWAYHNFCKKGKSTKKQGT